MKSKSVQLIIAAIFALSGSYDIIAQVHIGLRENKYAQIGYGFKEDWQITLEHSIYAEKFGFQKVRLYAEYKHSWGNAQLRANSYISTLWNGDYQDYGIALTGRYQLFIPWAIEATINPHYDSQYGYKTCYAISTDIHIIKALSAVAQYTTIPEYRLSEKRFRVGFNLSHGNLSVTPLLSIPVEGNIKSIRVLCSFHYKFK